jgi:hypothetical protein
MVRLNDIGMSDLWHDLDGVVAWFARIRDRDAVQKAFYFGSLLSEQYGDVKVR